MKYTQGKEMSRRDFNSLQTGDVVWATVGYLTYPGISTASEITRRENGVIYVHEFGDHVLRPMPDSDECTAEITPGVDYLWQVWHAVPELQDAPS